MSEILDDHLLEPKPEPSGEYEFFRDFFNAEQAAAFVEMLDERAIPYKLETTQTLLNSTIMGHGLVPHSILKLRAADFSLVNRLLMETAKNDEAFIANHYFQEYKAAELLEVVQKPDEWTPEDVAVARYLLDKQGVVIPEAQVEAYRMDRSSAMKAGKSVNPSMVIFYLLLILAAAFLLSIFFLVVGVGLGLYYWQDTTIDSDGIKFFTFEPATRNLGLVVFGISFALLVSWAISPFWLAAFF
jgi:hypothetical protein